MGARKVLNANQRLPILLTDGSKRVQQTSEVNARVGNMLRADDVYEKYGSYFGLMPRMDYLTKDDAMEDVRYWLLYHRTRSGDVVLFDRLAEEMVEAMPWQRYVILSPRGSIWD